MFAIYDIDMRMKSADPGLSRRHRPMSGFTIIEILVAAFLLTLLLSLIFAFLLPTMKAAALGSARAEIQQEALRALDSMGFDLMSSASSGISLCQPATEPEKGPLYIGILRVVNVDPQGNNIWEQALVVYYWKGAGSPLVRKVWSPASPPSLAIVISPDRPVRVGETDLSKIALDPGLSGQVLARDVSELLVTNSGMGASVSSPIELGITIARKAATGRSGSERFHLTRSVCLRYQL